ncbi:MAG TPA: hypothetical protein VFC56_17945 [Stellaceae bacterium]|nr:hypothetical protein [Stellaceae bacterium]
MQSLLVPVIESIRGRFDQAVRSCVPCAAAIIGLLLALAAPAFAEEPNRLTTGAVLAPILVPPGWIAEHGAAWTTDRPAYAAPCRTDEVTGELQYLAKLVDRDQDLRDTARAQLLHAVVEGYSTAKRHTDIAVDALMPLDNDIIAIDRLLLKLTALPACGSTAPAAETAAAVPAAPDAAPGAAPRQSAPEAAAVPLAPAAEPQPAPVATAVPLAPAAEPQPPAQATAVPVAPPVEAQPAAQATAVPVAPLTEAQPATISPPAATAPVTAYETGTAFRVRTYGSPRQAPQPAAAAAPEPPQPPAAQPVAAPAPMPEPPQPPAPAPPQQPAPAPAPAAAASAAPVPTAPVPPAPAAEKPAAAPRDDDIFVVRFDSKLPGLTPTGIRVLKAALRASDAGREVRIAIEGCEDRDSVPEGADCAELTRRLKRILAESGVDHPAELIAKPR